jgi:hypothetical protein
MKDAPRIYGLVKTLKPGVTRNNLKLRPVVSYDGSAMYNLAKYLGKIIRSSTLAILTNLRSSWKIKVYQRDTC